MLYNQRIRPHLDYGMTACPPGTAAAAKMLEAVQSKATAMVWGLKSLNSEERRKKLGLMTLNQRRDRGDLIEVFKMLNGMTRINPKMFWEVRDIRGSPWLPADLKMSKSNGTSKNRLDERLLKPN